MEVLVSSQQALEDARDVAQVEQVVDLGGGGQELAHHGLVHLYGGLRHDVTDGLHFLLKVLVGKMGDKIQLVNRRDYNSHSGTLWAWVLIFQRIFYYS